MLHHLAEPGLEAILAAGYNDAILAEPLLDSASPSPQLRVKAEYLGYEIVHCASFYTGARQAYLQGHKPRINVLDVPFSPLVFDFDDSISIEADHVAWARGLPPVVLEAEFENCTLQVYMAAVREWGAQPIMSVYEQQLTFHGPTRVLFYTSADLLKEAGSDTFAGLEVTNPFPADAELWRALGVV